MHVFRSCSLLEKAHTLCISTHKCVCLCMWVWVFLLFNSFFLIEKTDGNYHLQHLQHICGISASPRGVCCPAETGLGRRLRFKWTRFSNSHDQIRYGSDSPTYTALEILSHLTFEDEGVALCSGSHDPTCMKQERV